MQISDVCAPGSTNKRHLCSREHESATFVLPGVQANDDSPEDRLSAFDHVSSVSMELALLIPAVMSGLRRASTNGGTVSTRLT
jgi:hypothetical protein